MRIVFVMLNIVYLRNFESTVRLLAERGHSVELAIMHDKERGPHTEPLLHELCDGRRVTASWPGDLRDFWHALATIGRYVQDYLRYLRPEFRTAAKFRQRAATRVPALIRLALALPVVRVHPIPQLLIRLLSRLEQAIPVNRRIAAYLGERKAELLVVTPLVDLGSEQTDWVKAAKAIGVRTMLPVASWDNLTNKGNIRIIPDLVAVWNLEQEREAVALHGVPPTQVRVTGAEAYDHWFAWTTTRTREAFCEMVGLAADRPFIFYAGSSSFISGDETAFVRTWVRAVRSSPDPRVRTAGILIRPHPQNVHCWERFDVAEFADVVIWPRTRINPLVTGAKRDYFDCFFHSAAVVGINTSALIEAAIIGRPVLTILHTTFADTQEGSLHFHYLINSEYGFLRAARTFEQHVAELARCVREGDLTGDRHKRFVEAFIRPQGAATPATPILVAAIEELGQRSPAAAAADASRPGVLAVLLAPIAFLANVGLILRRWAVRGRAVTPIRTLAK
jgi:hypothetical protein